MGKVKKVLASKRLEPLGESYCGIELCETVHFHMPGFRFELTAEQFEVFAETVNEALAKWVELGKPATADFKVLAGEHLPGKPLYATRLEVEEQTVPAIHVHLRGLSLRPSIPEFVEYAEVIGEAKRNLKR